MWEGILGRGDENGTEEGTSRICSGDTRRSVARVRGTGEGAIRG